eukprot:145902_1
MSTTSVDTELLHLLSQLNHHPSIATFKRFLVDQEYDYELIVDDMQCPEDQSDILESVGKHLYLELKTLVCDTNQCQSVPVSDHSDIENDTKEPSEIHTNIEHKRDDGNPQHIQNLIPIVESLPNKNASHILLDFLRQENYSIDAIHEDIEDESNSIIFDYLIECHKLDRSFYTAFCDKIHQMDHRRYIDKALQTNDEWSVILQRMMQNHSFTDAIYSKTIEYFRTNQWTIQMYTEDELNSSYHNSEFHEIFPHMTDEDKRQLIQIFETAIKEQDEHKQSETAGQKDHVTPQYDDEDRDTHADIDDGHVCDATHPRYQQMESIVDYCAQMIQPQNTAPYGASDLKSLCAILTPNQVLELSDIVCRQYLIALYHTTEDGMNDYLTDITMNNTIMKLMQKFMETQYVPKPHDTHKFALYVAHAFNVLSLPRWLGYSIPPIAQIHAHDTTDDEWMDIRKFKGNARMVQIYIFAFLISSTRVLIKNFENTNASFMLDLKFPKHGAYNEQEGMMESWRIRKDSKMEIQNKILMFLEPFQNPQVRETVTDKLVNEHCLLIHTVDFSKDKGSAKRWNNLKPKLCPVNEKYIGFEVSENDYMRTLDTCQLFQICRVKRYRMMQRKNQSRTRYGGGSSGDGMSVSLHKCGNRLKFYLYCGESVFRLRCEDLCEWVPDMFDKRDTALQWKWTKDILTASLRDNEKLAESVHEIATPIGMDYDHDVQRNNHMECKKTNFWKRIQKWSDLDQEFYRKCDMFTYKMKRKYSLKYGCHVFDHNIVDKNAVLHSRF